MWLAILAAGLACGQESAAPPPACAGEPVEREFEFVLGPGVFRQNAPVFTVPEGKRLAVEQVTLFVRLGSGSGLVGELITGEANGPRTTRRYAVKTVESGAAEVWYVANQPMRAYVAGGRSVWAGVWRQFAWASGVVQGTVTGCLTEERAR
jgi:hypothetical protein